MAAKKTIRIVLVDDSTFARVVLAKHLNSVEDLEVVGQARNGQQALEVIPELDPDVVILDVIMPRLDGLQTLEKIMESDPRPVIMLSSLTREGADETIQALTLGAIDFIPKPSTKANIAEVMEELIPKIRGAAAVEGKMLRGKKLKPTPRTAARVQLAEGLERPEKLVVIGSSTGGPRALSTLIPMLPNETDAAYLVVQHMPEGFTKPLAERLNQISDVFVKEAGHGDPLLRGQALLAPGGYHLELINQRKVTLTNGPKIHGVRPAVDATMSSAAKYFEKAVLGVVLTGMGKDGRDGALSIQAAGGKVIAEDRSTCVVWGMPRSVEEAKAADYILPLPEIGSQITQVLELL